MYTVYKHALIVKPNFGVNRITRRTELPARDYESKHPPVELRPYSGTSGYGIALYGASTRSW